MKRKKRAFKKDETPKLENVWKVKCLLCGTQFYTTPQPFHCPKCGVIVNLNNEVVATTKVLCRRVSEGDLRRMGLREEEVADGTDTPKS